MAVNDFSFVLWILYTLPLLLVLLLVPSGHSAKLLSLRTALGPMTTAVAVGFFLGLLSAPGAFWLCNCGSSYTFPSGNNHFDEDIAVGHAFSLALLLPCYLHGSWLKRRQSSHSLFAIHTLIVALMLLAFWSGAVGWTPPGCEQSFWR